MNVLEALLRVQAEQDGTLAFRYACRGAVCGSCAMMINGHTDLACHTLLHGFQNDLVVLEPLGNFRVLKDLVVDLDPFFQKMLDVQPWLQPAQDPPEREYLVDPAKWAEAEPYTNCIECACCQAVCPAAERDPDYAGPAALAAQYRFLVDARDGEEAARLSRVDNPAGVWGCMMVWNCVHICPKGVPPTRGIAQTRIRILKKRKAAAAE